MTFSPREVQKFVVGFAVLMSLYLVMKAGAARYYVLGDTLTMTRSTLHWCMVYSAIPSFWIGVLVMKAWEAITRKGGEKGQ